MTTPVYGLNYLVQGEPVRNFRAYSQSNAEAIEAALIATGITPPDLADYLADIATFNTLATAGVFNDSGWVAVTTTSPAVAISGAAPQVRKIGKMVIARGGWTNGGQTANTTTASGTIPSGYRPSQQQEAVPGMSSAGSTGKLIIATTGVVSVAAGGTVAGYFRMDALVWTVD